MEHISQYIHRVGNDHIDGLRRILHYILGNILQNVDIGLSQIQTGHTGLSCYTAGNDNDIGIYSIVIVTGTDNRRRMERSALVNIQRLTDRLFGIDIDQHDFGGDTLHHQIIGYGCAYAACSDYANFAHKNPLLTIKYTDTNLHQNYRYYYTDTTFFCQVPLGTN